VALLIAPAIVTLTVGSQENPGIRYGIAGVAVVIIVAAVMVSKRRESTLHAEEPLHAP
jgi:K(+)-stimulated pyrophosphate-energized sodium pump